MPDASEKKIRDVFLELSPLDDGGDVIPKIYYLLGKKFEMFGIRGAILNR